MSDSSIYWYIARLSFNGNTRMKVILSSDFSNYKEGDKIVKVFTRGDKICLKILKACGTEYPLEYYKALCGSGTLFPFSIMEF